MPATRGSVMVPSRGKRPTRGQQRQTESQAAQPKGGEAKTRGKNLKRKPNAKVEGEKKTKVKQEKEDGRTKSTVEEPKGKRSMQRISKLKSMMSKRDRG